MTDFCRRGGEIVSASEKLALPEQTCSSLSVLKHFKSSKNLISIESFNLSNFLAWQIFLN
jgi:hypothetical protein